MASLSEGATPVQPPAQAEAALGEKCIKQAEKQDLTSGRHASSAKGTLVHFPQTPGKFVYFNLQPWPTKSLIIVNVPKKKYYWQ